MKKAMGNGLTVTIAMTFLALALTLLAWPFFKSIVQKSPIETRCLEFSALPIECFIEKNNKNVYVFVKQEGGEFDKIMAIVELDNGISLTEKVNAPGIFQTAEIKIKYDGSATPLKAMATAIISKDKELVCLPSPPITCNFNCDKTPLCKKYKEGERGGKENEEIQ